MRIVYECHSWAEVHALYQSLHKQFGEPVAPTPSPTVGKAPMEAPKPPVAPTQDTFLTKYRAKRRHEALSDPSSMLDLAPRIRSLLNAGGVQSLMHLSYLTEEEVLDISGIGYSYLSAVKAALAPHDLKLAPSEETP